MNPRTTQELGFEETVLPELEILYRSAWLMTHSETEAQDLVQETLLKAFKAFDRFDGRYPRAWLLTIMRNTQINRVRKGGFDLLNDPSRELESSNLFADPNDPEHIVVDPIFEVEVQAAYDSLGSKFKEVVNLVDINGLSYQDAADRIGVPVGTVMSRLHRARKQIRQSLGSPPKMEVDK